MKRLNRIWKGFLRKYESFLIKLVDSPISTNQDNLSPNPFPNGKGRFTPSSPRSGRGGLGRREVDFSPGREKRKGKREVL
jgi:hypothetical protein